MLSKNQLKLIKSLALKKYRTQHRLFTVEGIKGITEFLNSDYTLHHLYTTKAIFDTENYTLISETDLKKISSLKSPNTALAIFEIPEPKPVKLDGLIVALDNVRDPGNLGTIIRLCDWFGIPELVCNLEAVDCYNSKVVQSTMGSLTRVNVSYLDLEAFIDEHSITSFGTFMDGENVYQKQLPKSGIIVLGNEANGISGTLEKIIDERIAIPRFGTLKATESLNVATATAIILSEFKRGSTER
ncbi:TrmH family RNA methyltransferase [Winogradskyella sp. 3972H.M.0a.05]|uniref:TrmH family RNA methyltransferase n=1 Tax=Winogradskyella sp. 3972H.M.0a.05 TaxID=2950277 RepID=UPI00339537B7